MFDDAFLARFWAKVEIPTCSDGSPDRDACWMWIGAKTRGTYRNQFPYGHIKHRGRMMKSHRVACAIQTGEMPPDRDAAHSAACTSGLCVNPSHLEWQTPLENRQRDTARRHGALHRRRSVGIRHWI